ncbi:hypothetical protein P0136_05600 [Lentisphaerota bacterium ZTH]|nr:hypothetical protein JYG24_03285 [Lentisphaerota bacterium]WET07466.1 hypothetical protein P0136_05600 [Lentisphaerota bacterium ZTH]
MKFFHTVLILITGMIPYLAFSYEIKELALSKHMITSASISEDGKQLVYLGNDPETNTEAIFVSDVTEKGEFSKPSLAVNSRNLAEGLKEYFSKFIAKRNKCFLPELKPSGDFSLPTVYDKIISFSASLVNLRKGLFYAIKNGDKWKVYPIILQGKTAPGKGKLKIHDLTHPSMTINSEVIFIATLSDESEVVYAVKLIPEEKIKKKQFVILYESNRIRHSFCDVSVSQGSFALSARNFFNRRHMYIFDRSNRKLVKTMPEKCKGLQQCKRTFWQMLSLHKGKLACCAHAALKTKNRNYRHAIYSNAGGNDFSEPVVLSDKLIRPINGKFSRIIKPTLFIKNNIAYISFMGQLLKENNYGVYLAIIDSGRIDIRPIAVPGQRLAENKVIRHASVGSVGITNGIIPLIVKYKNGDNVIAVTKVF